MADFEPQQLDTDENGKPIMGFVIQKSDLKKLEIQINKLTKGNHILATKEDNGQLTVELFLFNPNPPQEMLEQIKNTVDKINNDSVNANQYKTLEGYDPSSLKFEKDG